LGETSLGEGLFLGGDPDKRKGTNYGKTLVQEEGEGEEKLARSGDVVLKRGLLCSGGKGGGGWGGQKTGRARKKYIKTI